jgi:hypothetical protein
MFKLDCYVFITIKETSVDYTQKEMRRESKFNTSKIPLNTKEDRDRGNEEP